MDYPRELTGAPRVICLPCGFIGHLDGCGYRCEDCMAIYGSIGCGCSNERRKEEAKKPSKPHGPRTS